MGEADTSSEIFRPSAWFTITTDNQIKVFVCKLELGQGNHTALPLTAAPSSIAITLWLKLKGRSPWD